MSREDLAAAKIQALRRGHKAREEIREKREREAAAATKIQALQRGRRSRKIADQKRRELALFVVPPTLQTTTYVDVKVSLVAMRQRCKSWDHLIQLIQEAELVDPRIKLDIDKMLYSTVVQPASFPNVFSRKVFEALVAADAARVLATKRRAEHETIEAAKPPPPPLASKEEGDEDEEEKRPTKSKKQLREDAEQRKSDRERIKAVLEAEYDADCRFQKLTNLLKLDSIRIPLQL